MKRDREEKLRNLPNVLRSKHLAEREKIALFMLGTGDFGNSARIANICGVSEFWLSLHDRLTPNHRSNPASQFVGNGIHRTGRRNKKNVRKESV